MILFGPVGVAPASNLKGFDLRTGLAGLFCKKSWVLVTKRSEMSLASARASGVGPNNKIAPSASTIRNDKKPVPCCDRGSMKVVSLLLMVSRKKVEINVPPNNDKPRAAGRQAEAIAGCKLQSNATP